MGIVLVGANHQSASVEVRERFSVPPERTKEALGALQCSPHIRECVLLSTCNRLEVVAASRAVCRAKEAIEGWLAEYGSVGPKDLEAYTYTFYDEEAAAHLFAVASGLDSLVVGEPQILGQVKEAYKQAGMFGSVGPTLHSLFHKAFHVAKRVRSETGIGEGNVSVSSVAVELAGQIFSRMADRNVLIIGAGEMGQTAARHFKARGVGTLYIANRTYSSARALAEELGGVPLTLPEIPNVLPEADVVLSAVSVDGYLIKAPDVVGLLKHRARGPLLILDIGLPRSIDPEIQSLPRAYLYAIDDLKRVVDDNLKAREHKAKEGMRLIVEEARAFVRVLEHSDVDELIATLRTNLEDLRQRELQRTLARLKDLSEKDRQALEILTVSLMDKFLHGPVMALKNGARESLPFLCESLVRLFQLERSQNQGQPWNGSESQPEKVRLP